MAEAPTRETEPNVSVRRGAPVLTPARRTPITRETPTPARSNETDTVQVWPHLVVIEFLGAVVITINMVLLGTLINGPLEALANPDRTPNPSKAPWYFLNLQELLLHMNSALAGVIVPTLALVGLAAIPYFDKGTRGLGVWFYSKRARGIMAFSAIYSLIVTFVLILFDAMIPVKDLFQSWIDPGNQSAGVAPGPLGGITIGLAGSDSTAQAAMKGTLTEAIVEWIWPIFIMVFFITLMIIILRVGWRGIDRTEIVIGLFTAFVAVYVLLTFVGTGMRGPGMHLFPPWNVPPTQTGGYIVHWLGTWFT